MRNKTWLALAAVLLLAGSASAAERDNTLTPKEVSDGWVLLFDGETPFGWMPRGEAKWTERDGLISAVPNSGKGVLTTTTVFGNFRLKADVWIDSTANSGIYIRSAEAVDGTPPDVTSANAYEVNIYDKHDKWPTGSINEVGKASRKVKTEGRWSKMEITADGDRFTVDVNGKQTLDVHDKKFTRGAIGLQYNGEGVVRFRNIKLQPLGEQSIFNGKDLSGWKVLPDHKSVYTVTPQGWLNVKNGNGDLQSEKMWGDFTLQLDIISNGEHLNSGVFFRAIPGTFWGGYEAQIRNQWEGNDRTKPVDFGTGAIYNRQPARKVISSDHEWFTMTVIAHGKHMSTWVNGIQTADFFDVRAPNESGRNGYRAAPGVLSLQGHDPTTDLSFRNIRIVEMPKGP